jgi:hypothetical protein
MRLVEVFPDNKLDVRDFLRLPFRLYNTSAVGSPAHARERARFSPIFLSTNTLRRVSFWFGMVWAAIGRIAVQNNRPFNDYRSQRNALVYLYEAIDDDDTAGCCSMLRQPGGARNLDRLLGRRAF